MEKEEPAAPKEEPPKEVKPPPTKRFKIDQIQKMNFKVKTEGNYVDERGITQYESCFICKWFIEKGNYYLMLGCGHRFHKKCMEMQLVSSSRCAKCGVEAQMHDLFAAECEGDEQITVPVKGPNNGNKETS